MKFLPGFEDERSVYFMCNSEVLLCIWAWFGDSYDFTFAWFIQRVLRVGLAVS